MKSVLSALVLIMFIFSGCAGTKMKEQSAYGNSKTDLLFANYFDTLQRLNEGNSIDSSDEEIREIIRFLTTVTKITPELDDTFMVVSGVTQTSLEVWKNWFYENKATLEWSEVNKLDKRIKKGMR